MVKLENSQEADTGGIFKLGERPMQGPILNELDERSRVFDDPLRQGLRIPRHRGLFLLLENNRDYTLLSPFLTLDRFETIFEDKYTTHVHPWLTSNNLHVVYSNETITFLSRLCSSVKKSKRERDSCSRD